MNLLPVQTSELNTGQPLPWDLFNQDQKQLHTQGEILSSADEELLKKSSLFRRQEENETTPISKPEPDKSATKNPNQYSFQDMHLKVGDKLQLKLPTNIVNSAEKNKLFTAELIGYVNDLSILIRSPQLAQQADLTLIEGDQITARLFSGQLAFSFSSYIEKIIKVPFSYIHLSFPTKITGQTIRKSRRIKTKIVATITDHPTSATISNLSMSGAEIHASDGIGQVGETIPLSFRIKLHGINKTMSLQAIIRSMKPTANKTDNVFAFGIEFIALETEQSHSLQSLVYQELVENPESHI